MRAAVALGSSLLICQWAIADTTRFSIHGQGYTQFGRIMHSSDSVTAIGRSDPPTNSINIDKTWMQSLGAQFTILADLNDHWDGAFGFGAYQATHALGTYNSGRDPTFLAISLFQNYITEARVTYSLNEKEHPGLSVTVGNFPYYYNSQAKNLGLYLLRGPVYPGTLVGGFEDFTADRTKSNMLGARIRQDVGSFSQDLILNSERDLPPTYDWSLAYVAQYQASNALELGAGVNFYRLIPYESKLETPGKLDEVSRDKRKYVEVDPVTNDTVFFTHQGIKIMGRFSLDLKKWINRPSFTEEDLKVYGEAAVIGIQNYGKTYGDIKQRIPVMLGFNIPTLGFLDHLSLEVEYYKSKYRNDLALVGNQNMVADWTLPVRTIASPAPTRYEDYGVDAQGNWVTPGDTTTRPQATARDFENLTQDDFKWSLHAQKTIKGHVRLIGQVANDHFRPRPVATGFITQDGGTAEAFTTPKDWYFMIRLGYFF